jgi:uncharacterized membrane protein
LSNAHRPRRPGGRIVGLARSFAARPRLLIAIAAAVLSYPLLPDTLRSTTRLLACFDVATLLYIVLAWAMMARSSVGHMRERADGEDEGALAVLVLTLGAAIASLGAIAVELHGIHTPAAESAPLRLVLVGITILSSWLFVHTIFAVHYAHECYGTRGETGGLKFPGPDREPDYWDFLYFSVTIGAAAATSDVNVVDHRVRRLVLAHTILAFLFNTTVLALAINVGASLI